MAVGRVNVGGGKYNINDNILIENLGLNTIDGTRNKLISITGIAKLLGYSEVDDALVVLRDSGSKRYLTKINYDGTIVWNYDFNSSFPTSIAVHQIHVTEQGYIYILSDSFMYCFDKEGNLIYSINAKLEFGALYKDDIYVIRGSHVSTSNAAGRVITRYSYTDSNPISKYTLAGASNYYSAIAIYDEKVYTIHNEIFTIYDLAFIEISSESIQALRYTTGISVGIKGEIFKHDDKFILALLDANYRTKATLVDSQLQQIAVINLKNGDLYTQLNRLQLQKGRFYATKVNERVEKYDANNFELITTYVSPIVTNLLALNEDKVFISAGSLYELATYYKIVR